MSFTHKHEGTATLPEPRFLAPVDKSLNRVTGVIESLTAARDARETLINNGFTDAEIHIAAGCDTANALRHGEFLFAVETPTHVRRNVAADILTRYGAHTENFVDRPY